MTSDAWDFAVSMTLGGFLIAFAVAFGAGLIFGFVHFVREMIG